VVVSVHFLIQGTGHFVVPTLDVAGSHWAPSFRASWVILEDCKKYPVVGSQVFVFIHSLIQGTGVFLFFTNAIEIDIINIANIIIPGIIYILYFLKLFIFLLYINIIKKYKY
jgi:hypothetical protein